MKTVIHSARQVADSAISATRADRPRKKGRELVVLREGDELNQGPSNSNTIDINDAQPDTELQDPESQDDIVRDYDEARRSTRNVRLLCIGISVSFVIAISVAATIIVQQQPQFQDDSAKAVGPVGSGESGLLPDAAGLSSPLAKTSSLPPPPPPTTTPRPEYPPLLPATFGYLSYADIVRRLRELEARYPQFVEVYNTQDRFGLPAAGNCAMDTGYGPCKVWVIVISNEELRTESTPEVFYSGTIHGDERVGPTAVTEFATMLLERYDSDSWVRRLVDTRSLTIVPAANALGYSNSVRTENGIDPNRDFSWDQHPTRCMQTVAARSINEIWLRHVFQLSVTFHGGTSLIAYPWGDTIHCNFQSYYCRSGWTAPDKTGMDMLVTSMATYVGRFGYVDNYLTGALNDPDVIYPVNGGMEDWAYGGSWSRPGPVQCSTGGRYTGATTYGNVTHRAVNLLVETADAKTPDAGTLGGSSDIFRAGGGSGGDGHVTRNVRLCLLLAEAVQPYVEIDSPSSLPTSISGGMSFPLTFRVGGAFTLDEAQVICIPEGGGDSVCQASPVTSQALWSRGRRPDAITLQVTVNSDVTGPAVVKLIVRAKVDQNWAVDSREESYLGLPQSHLVRARTDSNWYGHVEQSIVQGQVWFSSDPVRMNVNRRRALSTARKL